MQRNSRRRRRRRGVYIGPIPLVLMGLLLVILGGFLVSRALSGQEENVLPADNTQTDNDGSNAGEPQDPQTPPEDGDTPAPEPPAPNKLTTASGISCTLTNLGEEAVFQGDLVLVNNWTLFHFPDNQEEDLLCVLNNKTKSYVVKDSTVYLLPQALDALNTMMDDFLAQGGSKTVNVVAGHRTKEYQQHLFDQSAERNGLDHANKYVAQPGGSEHHTGLVVDFSVLYSNGSSAEYNGTGEYAWINDNCQDYGYVVRYETGKEELTGIWDEPWHFRYIGVPHATEAAAKEMCLEEYIDYLKQFTFDGEHLTIECADGKYEAWYTAGTEVYLPDSGEYSVSGNNVDGIIVTCKIA